MKEKAEAEPQRCCGNCGNHAVFEYPNKIFCSMLFCKGKNPIVETLWCCEDWNPSSQECYCIKEVLKSKNKVTNNTLIFKFKSKH